MKRTPEFLKCVTPTRIIVDEQYVTNMSFDHMGLSFMNNRSIGRNVMKITNQFNGNMTLPNEFQQRLQLKLSQYYQRESTLLFSSILHATMAFLSSICHDNDDDDIDLLIVQSDQYYLLNACKLSGMNISTLLDNNNNNNNNNGVVEELKRVLESNQQRGTRKYLLCESVDSITGKLLPLPAISDLCNRYNCRLILDESNSFCTLGNSGKGIEEYYQMGPIAEAILLNCYNSLGCSCAALITSKSTTAKINRRFDETSLGVTHCYTNSNSNTHRSDVLNYIQVLESLNELENNPAILSQIQYNSKYMRQLLKEIGYNVELSTCPMIPLTMDSEAKSFRLCKYMLDNGFYLRMKRCVNVSDNGRRLHQVIVNVTPLHSKEEIEHFVKLLHHFSHDNKMQPRL